MCYDKLRDYKKFILKEKRVSIFMLVLSSWPVPFLVWAMLKDFRAVFILLAFLIPILLTIQEIVNDNRLLNQFSNIEKNNALNKTTEYILHRPKVAMLCVTEIRCTISMSEEYYGIKLTDANKNKYYYFFDEILSYDRDSINAIIGKFNREISIQCYENTSIIKTIDKSPHFIRIRYGTFYE